MLQPFYTNSGSAYQRDNPRAFLQHNTTIQHNTLLYFALHWKYISKLNINIFLVSKAESLPKEFELKCLSCIIGVES